MKINRPELTRRLYNSLRNRDLKVTNAQASEVLDELLSFVIDSVGAGDEVSIAGFGSFKREYRNPTTKSNPQRPGETLQINGYHYAKFRPYSNFKETVREGKAEECSIN